MVLSSLTGVLLNPRSARDNELLDCYGRILFKDMANTRASGLTEPLYREALPHVAATGDQISSSTYERKWSARSDPKQSNSELTCVPSSLLPEFPREITNLLCGQRILTSHVSVMPEGDGHQRTHKPDRLEIRRLRLVGICVLDMPSNRLWTRYDPCPLCWWAFDRQVECLTVLFLVAGSDGVPISIRHKFRPFSSW